MLQRTEKLLITSIIETLNPENKKEREVISMNIRQKILAGAAIMLLATGSAWGDKGGIPNQNANEHARGRVSFQAPEIDAASGISGIALLTGIVLLMKERIRSRRSSKSDE